MAHGAPRVEQIRLRGRGRAVVHADETSWRENGRNGSIRALASGAGERYCAYHHSRAGAVINQLLGDDFASVLVSDFYAGYNDPPGGQHQRCWVHLLRDGHELASAFPHPVDLVGREVPAWTAAVKALWQRVHTAATSPPTARTAAQREQEAAERRDEVAALGTQFVARRDHPCHALAWRLWPFQGELLTCVLRPEVPADNTLAERTLRPQGIARKISGGTRSPRGSQTRMRLATLSATWSASGRDPLAEFRCLLQRPLPQV